MSDEVRFRDKYRIPSARLACWDYRWAGVYGVTICTHPRVRWFGEIVDGQAILSAEGRVVAEEWRKIPRVCTHAILDEWIVMPDHMHGIVVFQAGVSKKPEESSRLLAQSLGSVIGQFKSKATKRIRMDLNRSEFAWEPRFHDTILREPADLERMRAYIRENPARWKPQ
jgi:putative transposase